MLTTNSLSSVMVDGYIPSTGEEVVITVRGDSSYSCHSILFRRWDGKSVIDRVDEEGHWSVDYSPTNHFKNALVLRSSRGAVSSLWIALDSHRMVLWSCWGDPDAGIDLVYEKVQANQR